MDKAKEKLLHDINQVYDSGILNAGFRTSDMDMLADMERVLVSMQQNVKFQNQCIHFPVVRIVNPAYQFYLDFENGLFDDLTDDELEQFEAYIEEKSVKFHGEDIMEIAMNEHMVALQSMIPEMLSHIRAMRRLDFHSMAEEMLDKLPVLPEVIYNTGDASAFRVTEEMLDDYLNQMHVDAMFQKEQKQK